VSIIHDIKTYGLNVTNLIMQDKNRLIRTTARLIRHQIDAKTSLTNDNLKYIDDKIIQCGSYFHQLDVFYCFGNKPYLTV